MGKHTAAAIAFAFATASAHAAPRNLDAAALDRTTAGAQNPSGHQAADDEASIVVADQSSIDVGIRREVALDAAAQEQARAMNIVNAASADVANAVNLATIRGHVGGGQLNDLQQLDIDSGYAGRISLAGPNRSLSFHEESSRVSASSEQSMNAAILRSHSRTNASDTWSAGVPAYFPLQDLTITLGTPDLPAVNVPAFSFDLTTTDDVGGRYGIAGSLGPFMFDPPQIVLGTVSFQGDDLLVAGGYVDLPSLDLGSASITVCLVDCGSVSVDLPTIDGPRIDLPGEWRFEGANPFKDVRINAGNGIAAAGRGHIALDPAHVTLTADLSLDLPDLTTNFSFDVLGQSVNTGDFGVEIPPITASLTLVDEDIGFGYSADFDGALCLAVQTNDCGTLSQSQSSQATSIDIRQSSATASGFAHEEHSSSAQQSIAPGATLSGAEAELIAMSEGTATIEQASVIGLDAQAQRGMAALNAVNAAGTLVGNALNVAQQRPAAGAGVAQSNVFTQYKTRPRGL